MSDEDRYIPGVPCWIDTNQPDPEAAVAFYGGLFGWEFEDVTPPGAPGHVLPRAAPRRCRRRRRLAAGGARARGGLGHLRVGGGRRRDRRARSAPRAGAVLSEPARRRATRDGRRCAPTPRAPRSACGRPKEHRGAAVVNEPGSLNFNDLNTRDLDARAARSTERCSAGRSSTSAAASPGRSPATATSSSSATPGCARAWRRWAPRSGSRTSSRASRPISDDSAAALGRDLRRRRRRRDRGAGDRARRPGDRPPRSTRRGCG